jgi:hypothetical protein
VKSALPGTIWSANGDYEPIRSDQHMEEAFRYIKDDQGPGAWTWTFRDPPPPPLPFKRRPRRAPPQAGAEQAA